MVSLQNMTGERLLLARILFSQSLADEIERELDRRALGVSPQRRAFSVAQPVPTPAGRRLALFAA